MPFYHQLGKIPPKRHTQFKKPDGSFYFYQKENDKKEIKKILDKQGKLSQEEIMALLK